METEPDQLLPRRLAGHGKFERRRRCHIQHDVGPEISSVVNGIDVVIGGHYALATSDQLQPSWTQSSGNDTSTLLQHIYESFVGFLLVQSGCRCCFLWFNVCRTLIKRILPGGWKMSDASFSREQLGGENEGVVCWSLSENLVELRVIMQRHTRAQNSMCGLISAGRRLLFAKSKSLFCL